jgi:hypothetical protein
VMVARFQYVTVWVVVDKMAKKDVGRTVISLLQSSKRGDIVFLCGGSKM